MAESGSQGLQKSFVIYLFERNEMKDAAISNLFDSLTSNMKKTIMNTWDIHTEKGRKEGIELGIEQGIEQGREQGRGEGEEKKSYIVVKNLLSAKKFTVAEIANFASVSEWFVIAVKEEISK